MLDEQLDRLVVEGGEVMLAPRADQDLESFQVDVRRVRDLDHQGLVEITLEHPESMSGHRYIDRVRLRLTESGIAWRKGLNPNLLA
jgi:hypothetical protein